MSTRKPTASRLPRRPSRNLQSGEGFSRGAHQDASSQPSSQSFVPRPILKPRSVDFQDLERMFPMLQHLFDVQEWVKFMSLHTRFYPSLVQEFYGNLFWRNMRLYTHVKGVEIAIKFVTFGKALHLPWQGVEFERYQFDDAEACSIMSGKDKKNFSGDRVVLNANTFPPLQRIVHHIITTIIYPKGGSRDQVTTLHKFLFYCIFKEIPVALPQLMANLITCCGKQAKRSLPYAAVLTAIFENQGIDLSSEAYDELLSVHVYNRKNIERFMGYEITEGVVQRHLDSSDEASDGDGVDEDNRGAHGQEHVEAQDQDSTKEPMHTHQQGGYNFRETSSSQAQHGNVGSFNEWFMRFDSQLESLRGEVCQINTTVESLSQDMAAIRVHQQIVSDHMETQSQMYKEIMDCLFSPSDATSSQ